MYAGGGAPPENYLQGNPLSSALILAYGQVESEEVRGDP